MRVIDKTEARNHPGYCVFTRDIDGPFLDTGFWLGDAQIATELGVGNPYAYIHVPFVESLGRAVGMVPKHEVDALREQVEALSGELAKLQAYADAVETLREAEAEVIELRPDPDPVAA